MQVLIESQVSQLERAAVDIIAAVGVGPFSTNKLHLLKTNIPLTPTTPLADLAAAEADFAGYTAGGTALVWDVPGISADGTVEVTSVPLVFRPTDAVTPNNIFGVYTTDSGATKWYFLGTVDGAPVPLPDALHQLIITVFFRPATNSMSITIS